MICEFPNSKKDAACKWCGYRLRHNYDTVPTRLCDNQNPKLCMYLGSPREESVSVELLCGCKANRQRSTATFIVNDCAVNGRCLPGYTCSPEAVETLMVGEWATPCKGCEKYHAA